jgi:thioredoxin-dependent peroxiredoxin
MLKVGDRAPSFSLKDHEGRELRSDALLAKGPVVVYFYPKDFTPGCTQEACLFRDAYADLDGHGATIIGVSADDDASHKKFAERYRLPFSLVADVDRSLSKSFGVTRPLGLGAWRVTYVIDTAGVIRGAFHHELTMSKHLTEVKTALDQLTAKAS